MKRRPVTPFSLSFLDIMFCGFGAVVLLVLILDLDTVDARSAAFADLRADVLRLESSARVEREGIADLERRLDVAREELEAVRAAAGQDAGEAERIEASMASAISAARHSRAQIAALQAELRDLDAQRQAVPEPAPESGRGAKVHRFAGAGDRQYLTGLQVGGERILILLDTSASMLDESVVNVIRRRNMDDARKRAAPKWRRAQAVTEWLIANLPPDSRFQLYLFNTSATRPAGEGWLRAGDAATVARIVESVRGAVPADGTSLYHAFAAAAQLQPKPDNILLVTDGLPTQSKSRPGGSTVSGKERVGYFREAVKALPPTVPVNTILLPMEGDAQAAAMYWKLALDTRGAFLTPARDWP